MSNRPSAAGADARRRRRLGRLKWALAALLLSWMVASGDARAERIVLKTGEVIEGSIIEATRNTVIVRRSIGGMRQMRIQDIEEIRFDLAQGQEVAGEFLRWADGVYEVRSGDEVVRVSEAGIVSRGPRQETAEQPPQRPPSPSVEQQQVTAAAAPSVTTAERPAAPAPGDEDQTNAAVDAESEAAAVAERSAAGDTESQASDAEGEAARDTESQAAAVAEGEAAGDAESQAAAIVEGEAAGDAQTQASDAGSDAAADAESKAAADAETRAAADAEHEPAADADKEPVADAESRVAAAEENAAVGDQASLAVGDQASLAVKASVDPPEPGAESMVFKIELSQPADQTVVLIYGTVDGTAKAGEDYESQQGMVTLAPGDRSAEVRVPLLEGQEQDGEKRFELVLMADPKVAEIVDRRVIATIKGTD